MTKPIQWLGDSIDRVREFSETGRYHTGRELRLYSLEICRLIGSR
jgi:hypothetical protein